MGIRRTNSHGVPIWNDHELAIINAEILSRPCPVCKAVKGKRCFEIEYGGIGFVYDSRRKFMRSGSCHMGRLPKRFDSVEVVDKALKRERTVKKKLY